MAVKHIKQYYDSLCKQKQSLEQALSEVSSGLEIKMYSPEQFENLNKMIQPVLTTHQIMAYVMYLLNMPARPAKKSNYEKRTKKLIKNVDTKYSPENIIKENEEIIEKVKSEK